MTYPTDIPALRAALGSYTTAPDEVAEAIERAQMAGSIVVSCDILLTALKDRASELDQAGASVLAGAAELMLVNGWMGRGPEALAALNAAKARLDELATG